MAIRGARLSAELTPLDTQPVTITANEYIVSPRVASDGHDFLVAWSVGYQFDPQTTVRIRRFFSTGAPADSETTLFRGTLQDLVWDGANYDLAFSGGKPSDLAVARLNSSGHLLETLAISATTGDDRSASLVAVGNGRIIAAYTREAFGPLYNGVERAFVGVPQPLRRRVSTPH